jgi:hypothetical protein
VPYPDQHGRLAEAFAGAVVDEVRPPTMVAVALGSVLITATLLIPRVGPLVALGLLAAAACGYVSQSCLGTAGAWHERARLVLALEAVTVARVPTVRERVVRAGLGVLAAVALVASLIIRNQARWLGLIAALDSHRPVIGPVAVPS